MTDYIKIVQKALDTGKIYTFEQHGSSYVRKDDIITQVYEQPAMPDGEYQALAEYLENERGNHSLGRAFDFFPPVVPVDNRGTYYMVFTLPTLEVVKPYVTHVMEDTRRTYEATDQPAEYIYSSDVFRLAFFDYGGTLTEVETNEIVYQQFSHCTREAMEELGWTYDPDYDRFLRSKPFDTTKTRAMDSAFDGNRIVCPADVVSRDAYGRTYNMKLEEYSQEFQDYVAEMLVKYNYVKRGERLYVPQPIELPDSIEDIGQQLLSDPDLLYTTRYGKQLMPFPMIRQILRNDHRVVLSDVQLENQLLGREGEWRVPLVMNGFGLVRSSTWKDDIPSYKPPGEDIDAYVLTLEKHRRIITDQERKYDFAPGLPVTLVTLFLDTITDELVCLNMVGALSSVKANWAQLMKDRQVSYHSNYFKVGTSRNHKLFKATLPSGMHQWTLINKSASPQEINPTSTKCYIMTTDKSDDVPPDFIGILDKFLTVPLLPEWAKELWTIGRISGLIQYTGDPNIHIGGTCWTVRRGKDGNSWESLIQAYLNAGRLTF